MHTITRKFTFDAGHRVLGHEGKCRHIHGHTYVAEVTVRPTKEDLNILGMVLDFSVVKEKVGRWIEDNWDHNFICHRDDPILLAVQHPDAGPFTADIWRTKELFNGRVPYIMPHSDNPTAENMARVLYYQAENLLPNDVSVVSVRIRETPNCWSDYKED